MKEKLCTAYGFPNCCKKVMISLDGGKTYKEYTQKDCRADDLPLRKYTKPAPWKYQILTSKDGLELQKRHSPGTPSHQPSTVAFLGDLLGK